MVHRQCRHLPTVTGRRGSRCESPVVLAYRRMPVQRLQGSVRTIREGHRALALTL